MKVKKGDRIQFVPADSSGEDARLARRGIAMRSCDSGFVDLLCEGKDLDYRTHTDNIIGVHGNVFKEKEK